ncbi:hypothetical protein ACH5RR_004934 [Cinchona calisaya]|uniref:TF-B3 domain-containing protein n=1 Tax=Cinchona calisaya TaxID=153742 RepID=A0ABD3AZD3_9GENT
MEADQPSLELSLAPPSSSSSSSSSLTLSLSDFKTLPKSSESSTTLTTSTGRRYRPFTLTLLPFPKRIAKRTINFTDVFLPVERPSRSDVGVDDKLCAVTLSVQSSNDQYDFMEWHDNIMINGSRKRFLNSKKQLQGEEGVKKTKMISATAQSITMKTEPYDDDDDEFEGISTGSNDWRIKKRLTSSDVNGSSRLLLPSNQVKQFKSMLQGCHPERGKYVIVWDVDTNSVHDLVLRQWKTKCFVLSRNWKRDFVRRRNLVVNDEVGLFWDQTTSMLQFSVTNKN